MNNLDFEIEMKDGTGEIILDNCTIHFDPDNSAEHYLKRGISRKAFFRFAGQIGEIMLKCMEKKMTVDLELTHIRMENDVPNFSVYIGESGLTDEKAAVFLKELALKANFVGSDFLMYVYDYMTFIDANKDKPLNIIIGKIYAMESGTLESADLHPEYTQTMHVEEPVRMEQPLRSERPVRMEQPLRMEQPVRAEQSIRAEEPARVEHPVRREPEPGVTGTLTSFPFDTSYEKYSDNGETGTLDPSFWNRYGTAAGSEQNDNPHRVKRNEPSAVLQSLSDGQRYVLDKDCVVFGKDASSADYVLANDTISRAHAEIIRRNGGYYVTDLNSTNGTYINSKKLPKNTQIEVSNGDTVKFSNIELRFMII